MNRIKHVDETIEPAELEARNKVELIAAIKAARGTAVNITLHRASGKTTTYKFPMLKEETDERRHSRLTQVAKRAAKLTKEAFL